MSASPPPARLPAQADPLSFHLPAAACLQTCMDINECLSISELPANCTCPRCGCKNKYGGYE